MPSTIDLSQCTKEQRKQYGRMLRGAGKGDSPRNVYSESFRANYDRIFKKESRASKTQQA